MTAQSTTWGIERLWSVTTEDKTEQLRTVELSRFRAVVMLGAAGAGKTTEAERLAEHERASDASLHECRLAEFAESSTELREHLAALSTGADHKTAFYLDALDEAMIPARGRWLAIKRWVTERLQGTRASIRITCRSAVWPPELTQVIRDFAGDQSFATALLQPLSDEHILTAATSHVNDPVAFLERIHSSGARSLAGQPLSLRMLMRLHHQSRHGLPASQKDLFGRGLELLVSDPEDRHEIDTQNPVPPTELLEAAERLACYMILSGRETVHLGDEPPPHQLSLHDLSGRVTAEELRAIRLSGISDYTSPLSFRFGHRQFAEYLAGRRLARLPTHQATAFLAGPDGWKAGVAGPLRETAAFTAMFSADVADWIAARDPEVIGLSDVADSTRRAATLALLDRFRRGEMTDAQLLPGVLELKGLRYDHADVDLRPVLHDSGSGCDDVLECAVRLAASWELSSLSDDLADLVLDSAAPLRRRTAAGYALEQCGHATARQRLQPLIEGVPEDRDDDLKGIALRCNWPDHLSTPDLLRALTPRRRPTLYGAYESFLAQLDSEEFAAAGHVAAGLRWATTQSTQPSDADVLHRIAMRIAQRALHELEDARVSGKLTALIRHWARHYSSLVWLPQNRLEDRSGAEAEEKAPLRTTPGARRRLIAELVRVVETREELLTLVQLTPGLSQEIDFPWLLARACDRRRKMAARQNYLHLAWPLRWWNRPENISAWLRVCDDEPVKSILGNQKSVDLASGEARELREDWRTNAGRSRQHESRALDPPPRNRVLQRLRLAETKDIRHFRDLCRELTLELTSTYYGRLERFLTRTPGWREADCQTRDRIVDVARR